MAFGADGWSSRAARRASANLYKGINSRELIVMHYTAGYTAESAISTFVNGTASSAHFVVGADGAVTQLVSTRDGAWHAGFGEYLGRPKVNTFSIGIEIVNPGYHFRNPAGGFLNWQRKPVSAALLSPFGDMVEARDPWVGSAPAFWPSYPDAQLDAIEDLTRDLLDAYPSIVDIVGHRDVDGLRRLKVDPGPAFPMRRFRMLLDRRDDAPVAGQPMRVSTGGSTLNVRGGPGVGFETLRWGPLPNGAAVLVHERRQDWSLISRPGSDGAGEGWVASRYLAAG